MCLHLCRTTAAAVFVVLSGAAFADVTVSQSNDPSLLMADQLSSLFEVEHQAVNALPESKLNDLASGVVAAKPQSGQLPVTIEYTDAFLASQPEPAGDEQWDCMRKALYFEARGETLGGPVCRGGSHPEPGG